ncbi:IS481 family transposase [Maridesulfovibrio sp.]|uniref:IS481 family transposase n=1 Tax=unclassified Maridesulfovibrio TaxID=2794999 RepID=UPI003AFFBB82
MTEKQRARLGWVKLYEEVGDAGFVCRRCGISRPTLRKWYRRYKESGIDGLTDMSRRPKSSPRQKVCSATEFIILSMREERHLGAKRISSELLRLHDIKLSPPTIQKVLNRNKKGHLPSKFKRRKHTKRYNRPIPGDRVQIDVCKIAPGLYHYAAIDDCSRYKVMGLYPRRTAANTIRFLDRVVEEMPFPIQRVQTDRGREFFAYKVQEWLKEYCIKFRPIKPYSPHLNGKVERGHKTDLQEFYATADLSAPDLHDKLDEWQHFYNWHRPHSSLGGKTPMDRYYELNKKTPFSDEVVANYFPEEEPIREQHYKREQAVKKLK